MLQPYLERLVSGTESTVKCGLVGVKNGTALFLKYSVWY